MAIHFAGIMTASSISSGLKSRVWMFPFTPSDSKTYITRWTGNQGNKRKLKDFAVRNVKKYE